MYIRKDLKKYFDNLASNGAVPGGGSASALAGVLGIALSSMVAHFTVSSNRYIKVWPRVKRFLRRNETLRKRMEILIDKDILVFYSLIHL